MHHHHGTVNRATGKDERARQAQAVKGPQRYDSAVSRHMDSSPQGALPADCHYRTRCRSESTIPLIVVSAAIAVGCLIARRPNGVVLAVTAVPVTAFLGGNARQLT
jgi:hypothetical protein